MDSGVVSHLLLQSPESARLQSGQDLENKGLARLKSGRLVYPRLFEITTLESIMGHYTVSSYSMRFTS